jgi:hypothetical protein
MLKFFRIQSLNVQTLSGVKIANPQLMEQEYGFEPFNAASE